MLKDMNLKNTINPFALGLTAALSNALNKKTIELSKKTIERVAMNSSKLYNLFQEMKQARRQV